MACLILANEQRLRSESKGFASCKAIHSAPLARGCGRHSQFALTRECSTPAHGYFLSFLQNTWAMCGPVQLRLIGQRRLQALPLPPRVFVMQLLPVTTSHICISTRILIGCKSGDNLARSFRSIGPTGPELGNHYAIRRLNAHE